MSADKAPLLKASTSSSRRQGLYQLGPSRISFPPADTSALAKPDDVDEGQGGYEEETSAERRATRVLQERRRGSGDLEMGNREGIPKLSRECLWAEIKCYGSYIVPVLLIFGVLAIGLSLGIYGWKKGWFNGN